MLKQLWLPVLAGLQGVTAQLPQSPIVGEQAPLSGKLVKPMIDSEALQASITADNLLKRAEELYEIAKLGEEEYNHPTRVIGSEGASSVASSGEPSA
jgi:aminopeptidase Y